MKVIYMHDSWIVLIPPLLVLISSFITKKILPSLFLGIIAAAAISTNFYPFLTIKKVFLAFIEQLLILDTLYTFLFLIFLGALIALITITGGIKAYAHVIKKRIKTVRGAESASVILSMFLLFDDFFSSITIGSIMHPITDYFKIPRAKLAFLIDSLAAPLVILMPISSWIATLTMQLAKAGVSTSPPSLILSEPFALYLQVIPFIFYSILIFFSVLFIIRFRFSYGPMKKHEVIAQQTGNMVGGQETMHHIISTQSNRSGSLIDFLIPILLLVIGIIIALLYSGNHKFFYGTNSVTAALQQANIFFSLSLGAGIALITSFFYFYFTQKIHYSESITLTKSGFDLMGSSIAILFCSWTFSNLLINDLHTGDYLAHLLIGTLSPVYLPALFFIVSTITSIGIGSSWGTISLFVPLAIPMLIHFFHFPTPIAPHEIPLIFPLLGAIFSGAVAGDHISPLSSTTIMSAQSSGSYLHHHIWTQLFYAIPALIATIFAYILAGTLIAHGIWSSVLVTIPLALGVCFALLYIFNCLHTRLSK